MLSDFSSLFSLSFLSLSCNSNFSSLFSLSCLSLSFNSNFSFSKRSDARANSDAAVAFAFACTCECPVADEAGPLDEELLAAAACHTSSCDLRAALRLRCCPLDRLLLLLLHLLLDLPNVCIICAGCCGEALLPRTALRSKGGGFSGEVTGLRGPALEVAAERIAAGGRRGDCNLVAARLFDGVLGQAARCMTTVALLCTGSLSVALMSTLRLRLALLCSLLLLLLVSLVSPDTARRRLCRRSRVNGRCGREDLLDQPRCFLAISLRQADWEAGNYDVCHARLTAAGD